MITVEREIEVARSADEVFERLTRIEDLPRWQPAVKEAELTSPGPMARGSTIRIVVVVGGQRTVAKGTITEFDSPRLVGIDAKAGSAAIKASVAVSPVSDGSCRVAIRTEIALGGFLKFAEGMARTRIEREAPAAAESAREWLEQDA